MAKVLSSISGNLISAASAGYAPTNSADVSAIASAYQVVSATGTQLYAGTAYVTSINSAPISASRAGNAANASLATSAYYDGTGRLISSLPDAAEVSAIASAYATSKQDASGMSAYAYESSNSAKLDATAFSAVSGNFLTSETVTALGDDGTYITSINGSALSGQGGGGAQVVTATGSATVPILGFPPTTAAVVSSINGSGILPYGFSSLSANSAKWTSTNSAVSANSAGWTSTNSAVSANSAGWNSANSAVSANSANWNSTRTTVLNNSSNWNSVYNTVSNNSASWTGSTGGGGSVTSPSGTVLVMNDNEIEGTNSAALTASGQGFDESLSPQISQLGTYMQPLANGAVPYTGGTLMIAFNSYPYVDTNVILSGRGTGYGYESASGIIYSTSLIASIPMDGIVGDISASANNWLTMSNLPLTAKKDGGILVTGIGELAWASSVSGVVNTVSSNSATWGQGGVDSATVSSIASSYAESAASGKLDASAIGFGTNDGDLVASSISGRPIRAKYAVYDVNGIYLSSYALSADVSSTIETVSSNSATWGATPSAFPAEINTGTTTKAIITTGFQDGTGSRPTLFISSNPNSICFPRMLVSENHGATGKSSTYLGDAFEFYTGNSATGTKVLRIDTAQISGTGFYLDKNIIQGDDWSYGSAKNDQLTSVYDTVSSNSATWGAGGIDSATCSAIASSYANDVSAAVSGTVDTVSAQSANWGGSALALSAGPGVKLEKTGTTLVMSNDETVLFSGESFSATLTESIKNFERMYIEYGPSNYYSAPLAWYNTYVFSANDIFRGVHLEFVEHNGSNAYCFPKNTTFTWDANFTSLNATGGLQYRVSGNAIQNELTGNQLYIRKIVGINRTAEA